MHLNEFVPAIYGRSPYEGFDPGAYELDLQGWGSESPVFSAVIDRIGPTQIIEVGTWKGRSALHMAKLAAERGLDATILCIDTFLGSGEHWMAPEWRRSMRIAHGRPRLYEQFLANVVKSGRQDMIVPLALSSLCAAKLLDAMQVRADVIYIDGSHEENEVYLDIAAFWKLLRPGGVMIGDDYAEHWPGVIAAVTRFAGEQGVKVSTADMKWVAGKTAAAEAATDAATDAAGASGA